MSLSKRFRPTPVAAALALACAFLLPNVLASGPLDPILPATGIDVCQPPSMTRASVSATTRVFGDHGDAPDGTHLGSMSSLYTGAGASPTGHFPTLSDTANKLYPARPGARHTVTDQAWLGNQSHYPIGMHAPLAAGDVPPSRELDADASPDEDIRLNFVGPVADQDGYDDSLLPTVLTSGGFASFDVRVSAARDINWYLNVLVDWNYDGRWRNVAGSPPEWAVVNDPVHVPAGASFPYTTSPFAVGLAAGEPWVRVTLTPAPIPAHFYGAAGWNGEVPPYTNDASFLSAFPCGETEDYCGDVSVVSPTNATAGVTCGVRDPPPPPCDPAKDPKCCPPGADPRNCEPTECDPRTNPDCCPEGHYPPCEDDECPPGPDGSPECPPPEECDPNKPFSADVIAVSSGGVAATWEVSPWSGLSGWAVDASLARPYGITVKILYCNLEYGTSELRKTVSAPGTTPPGFRHSGGGFAMCDSGTHVETYPSPSGSGHIIDHGDYDVKVDYWWGCGPPLPPGTGMGTSHTRVIVR